MTFIKKKLSDCCTIISGSTPKRNKPEYWNGDINWVTPKDISKLGGVYIENAPEKISREGYESCSTTMLPVGSVLLSSRAPIGLLAITRSEMCTNQGFKSLIPGNEVNSLYLYYALLKIKDFIISKGSGSTFKEISKTVLSEIEIPLPPLGTQEKIAALLDRADGLRATRRAAMAKLDTLTQAVFVDFNKRYSNSFKSYTLEQIALEKKGAFVNGPFGSDLLTSELQPEGVPVIYIRDIKKGKYERISKVCISERKAEQLAVCKVFPDDVLIAKVGDPPGVACIYPKNEPMGIVTQDVIRICVDKNIADPYFIVSYLNSSIGKWKIAPIIVQGTRMRFALGRLKKIQIELPPLNMQSDFSKIIQNIESQKQQMQKSLDLLELNFESLLQRAFKGELTFNDAAFAALMKESAHGQ